MPSVLMLSTDFLLREKGGGGGGVGVIEDFNLQMEDLSERGGLIRAFTVSMKHFSHY